VRKHLVVVVLVFFSLLPDIAHAASDYASFESFYKESSSIYWGLAALIAFIFGLVIIVTGGMGSPIVVGIGTWIGNIMGLTGAAATNAGLALIGGGAVASGGFGVLGGTALLTMALSFSADVVIDYSVGELHAEYQYGKLTELSRKMITLPLPKNESGPDAYKEAMKALKGVDTQMTAFGKRNRNVIGQAIRVLRSDAGILDNDESSKNESLLSLLYFISNDYVNAKNHAMRARTYAQRAGIGHALPDFLYASSSLYEEELNFVWINNRFKDSVLKEPDNPLIPLLFTIYSDRVMLRFNDGYLGEEALRRIFLVMKSPKLIDFRLENYIGLLSRYFMRLKLEQQKISSLATTTNKTIKNSPCQIT